MQERILIIRYDDINNNLGKNTVFIAAEGVKRTWATKFEKRSSRYTTRWQELLLVV